MTKESSWVFVKNGGWYVKHPTKKGYVVCVFEDAQGRRCTKHSVDEPIKRNTSNMAAHLAKAHGFDEAKAKERAAGPLRQGLRNHVVQLEAPPILPDRQQQLRTHLGIALVNQMLPLTCIDKRAPHSVALVDARGTLVTEDMLRILCTTGSKRLCLSLSLLLLKLCGRIWKESRIF